MNAKRPLPHTHSYDIEKYKIVTLPIFAWAGGSTIALASDAADVSAEDLLLVNGAGDASYGEISTLGVNALHIDAAGDDCRIVWPVPYDCDVKSPIDFRVHWSSASTTTTDTITWKILYKALTVDSTALAAPTTALSTAIAADTNVAGANAMQKTAWGTLNGNLLAHDSYAILIVECDAADMTLASEATYAHFLDIRYVRRAL